MREPNGVDILAEVAGMSARTFARSFKQQTKVTPAAFVERARIDAARNRLEGGDLSLNVVADDCGFNSAEHIRLVFVKRLGITPSQYRASFGRLDGAWRLRTFIQNGQSPIKIQTETRPHKWSPIA
jgi:transcriptional regulator GlxA family with amidase domain